MKIELLMRNRVSLRDSVVIWFLIVVAMNVLWWRSYPNGFWFLRLWSALATGFAGGALAASTWAFIVAKRSKLAMVWGVLAVLWTPFAVMAFTVGVPTLSAEESLLRQFDQWGQQEGVTIRIRLGKDASALAEQIVVVGPAGCEPLRKAYRFCWNQDRTLERGTITVEANGTSVVMEARRVKRVPDGIVVYIKTDFGSDFALPGFLRWVSTANQTPPAATDERTQAGIVNDRIAWPISSPATWSQAP